MNQHEKRRLRIDVSRAFSPSAPIAVERLFAGRRKQLGALLDALPIRGRHAIVYGERGVGKTSFVRVGAIMISFDPDSEQVSIPYVSCVSTDTFDSIWRKVFDEIQVVLESPKGPPTESTAAYSLPKDIVLTPEWIRRYLEHYGQDCTLVVTIDEFDCLPDEGERRLFAETIKLLSDRAVPATIILVGVADDVSSLLAEHASIERAMVQVQMPRMSRIELEEIVDKALAQVSMKSESMAKEQITFLSQGLPHYTHLLGLEAAKQAIEDNSMTIRVKHIIPAIRVAIDNAQVTIRESYHKATMSAHKDNLYSTALLACAIAQGDEQGYFAAADVREPMCKITEVDYEIPAYSRHLHDFCEESRGMVLRKTGTKHNFRFRFKNPLLQPYVILKGIAANLVSEETLKRLARPH